MTIFTNGLSLLSNEQLRKLEQFKIRVIEKEIDHLGHNNGYLQFIKFRDGSIASLGVLYAPGPFEQHCKIPERLGCLLTEEGYIKTDENFETSVNGVYAVGDNASKMRSVANAVAMGTASGIMISKKIILAE